eukprot:m.677550 g.677550  ORF g.677550 m.677550 type:complete len:641 (-) comp22798_c1_seq1:986-2908(-)
MTSNFSSFRLGMPIRMIVLAVLYNCCSAIMRTTGDTAEADLPPPAAAAGSETIRHHVSRGQAFVAPNRSVSFWYAPAANDVNQTIAVLTAHAKVVTSVMLYCGHSVDVNGRIIGSVMPLCSDILLPKLKALGIGAEFVLNDGSTNVTAHKLMMANVTAVSAELAAIGKQHGIYGWNLDLEPQSVPGTAADAPIYAAFCAKLKAVLNAGNMRLTIDVATWSPMLRQFALLAPSVDRMMDMETYNANSMMGWVNGDLFGGYYKEFVNDNVPRSANGIGLGSWPTATCGGTHLCWSTTAASGQPRMERIAADNVPEVALFRLYGDQNAATPPDQRWPEDWWWPLLTSYMSGATDLGGNGDIPSDTSDSSLRAPAAGTSSFCDPVADAWAAEFVEEFDGDVLNASVWTVKTGGGNSYCRSATCTTEDVYVEDGSLVIRTRRDPANASAYFSGGVDTRDKVTWKDTPAFRLCVSAILPGGGHGLAGGRGMWPAHWMMPNDASCDPDEGEMDIMEMIDGDGVTHGTYHWQTTWPKHNCSYPNGHESMSGDQKLPTDWWNTYHEYAVERSSTHLAFVVDGQTILNTTDAHAKPLPGKPALWPMPFHLILNSAIGGPWPGEPDAGTVLPTYHKIDYVKVTRAVSQGSQ